MVMEAYVHGVSTRAVDDLVEAMGSKAGISKSEVSRICAGLDEAVGAFRGRRLDHSRFPYIWLDATYLHVRADHQVTSKAVVVATGVTEDGRREILGIEIGDSEDEVFWREFLRGLKRRGLSGVRLVISDQHAGLVAAIRRCFQGAGHQRCRVHFARNLLANIPKGHQEMVAAAFRTIFAQVSPEEISAQWDHVANMLTERFDKAAALMLRAKEEVLAFGTFPRAHWRQIWSTNPQVILSPGQIHASDVRVCDLDGVFDAGSQDCPRAPEIFSAEPCLWPMGAPMMARLAPRASARASRRRRFSFWSSRIRSLATSSRRTKEASEIFCRSGMSLLVVEFRRPRSRSISPRSSVWV